MARLNELRSQHRAVLVDFTAAWCLMCQVNHRVAFQSSEVAERFKQKNVAFLRGDWTNRSELITSFMRDHGRDGVPLDLFFSDREATPVVLPALLTPGELLSLVE